MISVYRAVSADCTLTVTRDEDTATVSAGAPPKAEETVTVSRIAEDGEAVEQR